MCFLVFRKAEQKLLEKQTCRFNEIFRNRMFPKQWVEISVETHDLFAFPNYELLVGVECN